VIGLFYRAAGAIRRRLYASDHGRVGEDLAHRYLRRKGCTVVARNFRSRSGAGEIDLVAWDGDALAFVEVKTRSSEEYGAPEAAVDAEKRIALERTAREYSLRSGVEWEKARFDIVSVVLQRPPRIEWLRDAFR
jgi:putative endonuclease